jgi:hypothetical protein
MKLFIDLTSRRFVKSAASSAALPTLVLKRRDVMPVEVIFVQRGAAVATPSGTSIRVALKSKFSDANFLALAESGTLDLYTTAVEDLFPGSTASADALLEVRYTRTGEATRTATLQVEIQNAVILGTEGTPAVVPDGKATQLEAEAGTDNTKWMTPLRTAQAIAELAPPPTWDSVTGKPTSFPPATHTHATTDIIGLSAFIVASAPGLSITTTTHIADGLTDTYSVGGLASADPSAVLVSLNGVTQSPGTDYMVNLATSKIIFDDYPSAGQQIVFTALGLRSVQRPIDPTLYIYAFDQSSNGLTTYSGRLLNADRPAAPALPETASTWTIKRSTLNANGRVLSTTSSVGSWLNRETLAYA